VKSIDRISEKDPVLEQGNIVAICSRPVFTGLDLAEKPSLHQMRIRFL